MGIANAACIFADENPEHASVKEGGDSMKPRDDVRKKHADVYVRLEQRHEQALRFCLEQTTTDALATLVIRSGIGEGQIIWQADYDDRRSQLEFFARMVEALDKMIVTEAAE
jgi:hypothetical protein